MVVVTGANGLVGARVCELLAEAGAGVRAVVRKSGSAPRLPGLEEHVGDFHDPEVAAAAVAGADALVTTVHPLGGAAETQHEIAVEGTPVIARAARDAGSSRLVHVSTAAVYDRSPGTGDVDESVGAGRRRQRRLRSHQARHRRRPRRDRRDHPGAGEAAGDPGRRARRRCGTPCARRRSATTSAARHAQPDKTFAWVHVDDLAALVADLATGRVATSDDPEEGPVAGGCTAGERGRRPGDRSATTSRR